MERLRDTNPASGSAEAELVQAIAAMEPVASSPARQQRILEAVNARRARPRRSAAFLLRPAIAGIVLLAGAATAAATVGHGWATREWHRLVDRSGTLGGFPNPPATTPLGKDQLRQRDQPSPAEIVVAPVPQPVPPAPAVHAPVMHAAVRARPPRGEDPTALVDAVHALRSEHDPPRAARLLDAYLRAYPRGALAEEALALQIEAAASMKSPRAAEFAQQYLRMYPTGRFRQAARQALDAARN